MKITLEQLLSAVYIGEPIEVYDKNGMLIIDTDCINPRYMIDDFSDVEVINVRVKSSMNNGHCNIADSSFTCTDCYFQCTRKQVVKAKRNE